jgi:hypothetical protein
VKRQTAGTDRPTILVIMASGEAWGEAEESIDNPDPDGVRTN